MSYDAIVVIRLGVMVMAAVALLAACGGNGDPAQRAAQTVIQEEDQQRAEGALLTLSDFPAGWSAVPAEDDEDEGLPDCLDDVQPDLSDLTVTGEAESDGFSPDGIATVGSAATVYETEEQARTSFEQGVAAFESDETAECFTALFESEAAAEDADVEVEVGEITVAEVAFPDLAEEIAAIQIVIPVTFEGEDDLTVLIDFVGMREERALGTVFSITVEDSLPPEELERLARAVAERLGP